MCLLALVRHIISKQYKFRDLAKNRNCSFGCTWILITWRKWPFWPFFIQKGNKDVIKLGAVSGFMTLTSNTLRLASSSSYSSSCAWIKTASSCFFNCRQPSLCPDVLHRSTNHPSGHQLQALHSTGGVSVHLFADSIHNSISCNILMVAQKYASSIIMSYHAVTTHKNWHLHKPTCLK